MTTYVYETLPLKAGDKPRYYEIKQSMNDAPLTKHPETGEPIRRVVLGGFGVLSSGKSGGQPASSGSSCCGPGCGCH
jgi:predicted nucleic acid-binding Zn ribbon protein